MDCNLPNVSLVGGKVGYIVKNTIFTKNLQFNTDNECERVIYPSFEEICSLFLLLRFYYVTLAGHTF